jgi:hypothetical protein
VEVTAEFERRLPSGETSIRARLSGPQRRLGLERRLLPSLKVGLKGWHRAHSIGPGLGAERAGGILYAPPRVNLELQNAGIEEYLRGLVAERRRGVEIYLTTETRAHPGTRRLAVIQYLVEAVENGERHPLLEASITIGNTKNDPRVVYGATRRLPVEPFLKPVAPAPRPTASKVPPKSAPLEESRAVTGRATGSRALGRFARGVPPLSLGVNVAGAVFLPLAGAKRVSELRERTGYAPPGTEYTDGSRVLATTRYVMDPSLTEAFSMEDRYEVRAFRAALKDRADRIPVGGRMAVKWDVRAGDKSLPNGRVVPNVEQVRIVYRKLRNGRWLDVAAESDDWPREAVIPFAPNIDRIIDPTRTDAEVERHLGRRSSSATLGGPS